MLERTLFLQEAVDREAARIASKPFDWIYELPMHSKYEFEYSGEQINGVIQFLSKDSRRMNNSFMLMISGTLSLGVYRSYTSGFLFNDKEVTLLTTDEVKLSARV